MPETTAPVQKTKIQIIEHALERLPGVKVVKNEAEGGRGGYAITTNDIRIAPTEPLSSSKELRELVERVRQAVGVPVSCEDRVWGFVGDGLRIPVLYYDEPIGKRAMTTTVTLTAPGAENMQGVPQAGTSTKEEDICRRTWVRVYPSIRAAEHSEYHLSLGELGRLVKHGFELDELPKPEQSTSRGILRGILGRRS